MSDLVRLIPGKINLPKFCDKMPTGVPLAARLAHLSKHKVGLVSGVCFVRAYF
jgi:hypothetical protein